MKSTALGLGLGLLLSFGCTPNQVLAGEVTTNMVVGHAHISPHFGNTGRSLQSSVNDFLAADNGIDTVQTLNRYFPELVSNARHIYAEMADLSVIAFGGDDALDNIKDAGFLFPTDPAENIDQSFRRKADDGLSDAWVGIGWISFTDIERIEDSGGACPGEEDWKDCLEIIDQDTFVLKMRPNHPGWLVHGAGLLRLPDMDVDPGESATLASQLLSSAKWSELAEDYYLIVPDDSVRGGRTVRIELWEHGAREPKATTTDLRPNWSAQSTDSDGGTTRNVCGGTSACPMFRVSEDDLTAWGIEPRS